MEKNLLSTASPKLISRCMPAVLAAIFYTMYQLCPVAGKAQTIYWLQSLTPAGVKTQLVSTPPVSANMATTLATPQTPLYIFADDRNGLIYWSDAGTGSIRRVSKAGGAITEVVTGITGVGIYARGIYLDITNKVLYWAESAPGVADVVKKASISGSLPVASSSGTVVVSGIDVVRGITVDTLAGKVYYVDAGTFGSGRGIYRAAISSSSTEASSVKVAALTAGSGSQPNSVRIDNANNFVYWSDGTTAGKIQRAAINAASFPAAQTNVYTGTVPIRAIAIDPGKNTIYWTEFYAQRIQKASLSTIPIVSPTTFINALTGFPRDISIKSDTCKSYATPSVTIAADKSSPVCAGTKVTFTATAVNGGTPIYDWYKNRVHVGVNSNIYADSTLQSNDTVWCDITSSLACITVQKVKSNILVYTVNPAVSTTVSISSYPYSPICAKTKVTFTASDYGSPSFVHQWYKNNIAVGNSSNTYIDSVLNNNDSVWTLSTGSATCATTAKSNVITYSVTPLVTPSVSIVADKASPICAKTKVTFTATAVNGGTPVYEWHKNRAHVGGNSNIYADSMLQSNDTVWCDITSSIGCVTIQKVKSNVLVYTVNPLINPSVSIVADIASPICTKTKVTFTATAVNGGTPIYEWHKNRAHVGGNSSIYVDSVLQSNDTVWCDITTSLTGCITTPKVKSNVLVYTVNASIPAQPSAISGPTSVFWNLPYTYSVTNVAGVNYIWTVPSGVTINSGQGTYSINVTWGSTSGTVSVAANNACGTSAASSLAVTGSPGFTSGKQIGYSNSSEQVQLYPNPASTTTSLNLSGFKGGLMVTVTDMAGHIVWQQDKLINGNYMLKVSNLAQGMYIVTVKYKSGIRSLKLIKAN